MPNEIPKTHWPIEGKEYTIVWAARLDIQGIWGVKLAEIDLSPFVPFTFFDAARFVPLEGDPEQEKAIEELLEEVGITE